MANSWRLLVLVGLAAGLAAPPLQAQQSLEQMDRRAQGAGPEEVGPEEVETLIASAPVAGPSIPTTATISQPGTFALPASAEAYGPYSNIQPLAGGVPLDAGAPAGGVLPASITLATLPFGAIAPAAAPVPIAVQVPAVVPVAVPATGYVPPVVLTTTPDSIGPAQFPAPPPPNAYGPKGPAQTASGT